MTKTEIKESLLEQLRLQNKTSDFYLDLVSDYMDYWSLKEVDYRYPEKRDPVRNGQWKWYRGRKTQ